MTSIETKKFKDLMVECGGDPDRAQFEWMRWKCLTDLYFLGTEVLGLGKVKKRVYPKFHRWLCHVMSKDGNKMILVPRKHAKTTWMEARIVQVILQNEGRTRIMMLSLTERLVTASLASVKRHLSRPLLRKLFPEVIADPGKDYHGWVKSTTNELKMRDYSDYAAKEPQIYALGSAAAVTGMAVDYIFMDDYIDDETCRSVSKMEKAVDDWRYIQPLLDDGGEIMITGTFYHYNDLYNVILKEKHIARENVYVRRAIENEKILYPTMFSQRKLDELRKILGNYIFSCQYMLDPIPKEDQIFPGPQPTCDRLPTNKYRYFITVDPAPTTKDKSDSTGVAIAAIDSSKRIWFVEAFSMKGDGAAKADMLIKKCLQYKPERIGIEWGLQTDLGYIIKTRMCEFENTNHVRVPALGNIYPIKLNNKTSKADRIYLTLGSFVRAGQVQIKENTCVELIRQMDMFTGIGNEEDDVVDAASMLFPLVGEFGTPTSLIERIEAGANSFFGVFKGKKKDNSWWSNFVGGDNA